MLFPTDENPNKGLLEVLHVWVPTRGPPETTLHSPKVNESEKHFDGLNKKNLGGVGKFFVCNRDMFFG